MRWMTWLAVSNRPSDTEYSTIMAALKIKQDELNELMTKERRCTLKPFEPRAEGAWFQRLKLTYDKLLLSIAFKVICDTTLSWRRWSCS